jgi:CxxC-x17-CxxC domain-containing protein
LPESSDLLTHRVGRTGRMGRKGQALTLLGPDDGAKWRQLERGLGRRIPRRPWTGAVAARKVDPSTLAVEAVPAARSAKIADRPIVEPATGGPRQPTRRITTPAPSASQPRAAGRTRVAPPTRQARERDDWDEIRHDQRVSATGELIAAHGRDPQRPSWAGVPAVAVHTAAVTTDAPKRSDQNGRHPRSAHEIICTDCGNAATVRFRPDPTRPVYCEACYQARGPRRAAPIGAGR